MSAVFNAKVDPVLGLSGANVEGVSVIQEVERIRKEIESRPKVNLKENFQTEIDFLNSKIKELKALNSDSSTQNGNKALEGYKFDLCMSGLKCGQVIGLAQKAMQSYGYTATLS